MKRPVHIEEARQIGADSFALLQYDQLPRNASAARQIDALKRDQHWQQLHHDEVSSRIDRLIADIEATSNAAITANKVRSGPAASAGTLPHMVGLSESETRT